VSIFNSLQAGNDAIDGNGNAVAGGNARLLADALALRATAIGGGTVSGSGATAAITPTRLYDFKYAEPITGYLSAWTISPSCDLSRDVSVYASVAQGAKSGYINFSSAGDAAHIKPEVSRDYELGLKSLLLNRRLLLNANLYRTQVKNYQASWRRPNPLDPDNRAADITGTGNVESIGAKGFELQATYQVFPGFSINVNSSYNIAKYETDWLVALPPQSDAELASPRYINAKGQQLASVPKFGNAYGVSYRKPIGAFLANVSISNRYVGKKYSQDYHTEDTLRAGYSLTNLVVGLGSGEDDSWELSARITNLFDKSYGSYGTWGATSAATATPGAPRNFQLVFRSRIF
jgi:iron complex outermembrane receptor protein